MTNPRPRFSPNSLAWPLVLLTLSLAWAYTTDVDASRTASVLAAPTAVAVVDVARLVEEIDERGEWDMRIEALQAAINSEGKDRQAAMERRLKESESTSDEATRQTIRDEVAMMQLRSEQWALIKGQELDRERSLKWKSIYRNLRREAARVAEADGYELVLVNDSTAEIMTNQNAQASLEQQVLMQIQNRRILFSAAPINITEQVIVRMNNALPQP